MTETTDIAELFALDPLNCTREDIKSIIAEFRSRRHQFNAPKPVVAKRAAKVPGTAAGKNTSLADKIAEELEDGDF